MAPLLPRLARTSCVIGALTASGLAPQALAADPQPYRATIAGTGNAALDQAIKDSSTLLTLHDRAPVGAFALVARARNDVDRITSALHSYGYYLGSVGIGIAGHPLDDPALPGLLDATPATETVAVQVKPTIGALFHIGHVTLTGDVPPGATGLLKLAPGSPALAADVLAAHDRLLGGLLDQGRALAKVQPPVATLDLAHTALDVSFVVTAGPRVDLGPISITGETDLHENYLRRRLLLRQGQPYDPVAIEKARQDLAAVPALAAVRITEPEALDAAGQLPVTVAVTERPLHAVDLGAAYATDLGGSATASWTHRNLFGNAETLTLSAAATGLGGSVEKQPGYNIGGVLTLPDFLHRGQSLSFGVTALKEYLQAYNRTAALTNVTLSRKLSPALTVSGGPAFEVAKITQEGLSNTYKLVQLPLNASYDDTGSIFDPVHGYRASLTITPTLSLNNPGANQAAFRHEAALLGSGASGNGSSQFVILQASGSTYVDLGQDLFGSRAGRSVLAVRGLVGSIDGASTFDLPPDQRFYAGGGGTVRGFRYQSIGPRFSDNHPIGGTSIEIGSVEMRQRFGASYGVVAFIDAGEVGSSSNPFGGSNGALQVGAGVGARYYTSIGPIRVDVAVPVNKQANQKTDIVELYIGIGQAF